MEKRLRCARAERGKEKKKHLLTWWVRVGWKLKTKEREKKTNYNVEKGERVSDFSLPFCFIEFLIPILLRMTRTQPEQPIYVQNWKLSLFFGWIETEKSSSERDEYDFLFLPRSTVNFKLYVVTDGLINRNRGEVGEYWYWLKVTEITGFGDKNAGERITKARRANMSRPAFLALSSAIIIMWMAGFRPALTSCLLHVLHPVAPSLCV